MNRDSVTLTVTIIVGILGVFAAQADAFGPQWKTVITLAFSVASTVAAILKSSPLVGKDADPDTAKSILGIQFKK